MQGCVIYYWDEANNQYIFKYDEECTITIDVLEGLPISEVIARDFPHLNLGSNGCSNLGDNNYSYINGCYLKGNPDNNYIWYSGFLWRIMGVNADGTIKLVSTENITAIPYGTSTDFNSSYVRDWLNNYFLGNLRKPEVIADGNWCVDQSTSDSNARTTCNNLVSSKVGLLTLDEYNLAGFRSSYLNIYQMQFTITPYSNTILINLSGGYGSIQSSGVDDLYGIRPSINILPDTIVSGGTGTVTGDWSNESGPYILNEDKSKDVTGLLESKATSGEYVLLEGKKYRVVSIDKDGNTKLILDSFYEEPDGTLYEMEFGTSSTFSTTSGIGSKLNNDVLNWLLTDKSKLVTDYTWYQNTFVPGSDYKVSLNEDSPDLKINSTVGLLRIGEMLSANGSSILTQGYTKTSNSGYGESYWSINPSDGSHVYDISSGYGIAAERELTVKEYIRPVIVVNSTVSITGGSGTFTNPYQI